MAAKDAGVSYVKGQDWHPIEDMRRPQEWKDRCSPWTLTPLLIEQIAGMCEEWEIPFFASIFTRDAVQRAKDLEYSVLKIASSEVINYDLFSEIFRIGFFDKDVIISLGEASLPEMLILTDWEIESYDDGDFCPVYALCIAKYPANKSDALDLILQMSKSMPRGTARKWAWSSHVSYPDAIDVAVMAAERGARYIEVHMRLENTPAESPDNGSWSLYPNELAELITAVRGTE